MRVLPVLATALLAILGTGAVAADDLDFDRDSRFNNLRAFGLTADGRLVRFRTDAPERARDVAAIAGLAGMDSTLVGIDFRVQDGKLYGVGNAGGVYTIDTTTAHATLVNALTVPLSGTQFGVDFNPAADRLRIISDTGQNLAHNVNAGGVTAANGTLTSTVPPAAPVPALGVTAAALDTTLDQIVIQSPPGNGVLVATGQLGSNAGPAAGMDIYTSLSKGVAVGNRAYATWPVSEKWSFYRIDLLTGRATRLGAFDGAVVDVALPLNQ